jgi:hypothetical protein
MTQSPGLKRGDVGADGDDLAGGLAAWDERGFGAELVFAGQHQHVDVLHAAGADADGDLAGAGRRWIGDVTQREHLRAAECLADHGFHGWVPRVVDAGSMGDGRR